MNECLIDEWNQIVVKGDLVYHLGDLSFSTDLDENRKILQALEGQKFLVLGNHDRKRKIHQLVDQFEWIGDIKKLRIPWEDDYIRIALSHYPMTTWDGSITGSWQLYGHCHNTVESWMDEHMPGRLSLDVGVDNAKKLLGSYRPFSVEDILTIFKDRKGYSADVGTLSPDLKGRWNIDD